MQCHFVYAVPVKGFLQRLERRLRVALGNFCIPIGLVGDRHPRENSLCEWPDSSPYANTKNIYRALSRKFKTSLYHLTEKVDIKFNRDDVFIGHPYFPVVGGEAGVTEHAVAGHSRPKCLALITPLHCDLTVNTAHINKAFLEHVDALLPKSDVLFSIMGQYWWERWDSSPYAHWKPKMVRLDMAIDSSRYPYVRKKFNPPGKRRFLYIGRNDPMKGVEYLSRLAKSFSDYEFGWIGHGGDIPGVKHVSGPRPLTGEYMAKIAEEYDFFISPSVADPNPTTILESMAWGFPVLCTPQSGYYETGWLKNIYFDQPEKTAAVLECFQSASEVELLALSVTARQVVEKEYTWAKFTDTILKTLLEKL